MQWLGGGMVGEVVSLQSRTEVWLRVGKAMTGTEDAQDIAHHPASSRQPLIVLNFQGAWGVEGFWGVILQRRIFGNTRKLKHIRKYSGSDPHPPPV